MKKIRDRILVVLRIPFTILIAVFGGKNVLNINTSPRAPADFRPYSVQSLFDFYLLAIAITLFLWPLFTWGVALTQRVFGWETSYKQKIGFIWISLWVSLAYVFFLFPKFV